jgi:hypothetical protein
MASHMKTTVHIPDLLLAEAQTLAAQENTTLKALIAEGLQKVISDRKSYKPFELKDCSFPPVEQAGKMVVEPRDWSDIASLVYGDRVG